MSGRQNPRNLASWLQYIESTHISTINMGLTRTRKVFVCLQQLIQAHLRENNRPTFSFENICVTTVAGTNGKGTTCRFIEQACLTAKLSVGVYASPHIQHFNERIRINGSDVSDTILCDGFAWVEQARAIAAEQAVNGVLSLTYFEYATLCAFAQFMLSGVKVWVLEVGLGGRLDATNIIDANVSVITSIGLDHQSYLGDTTEQIAYEKAGIIKENQAVIVGYENVHQSVLKVIEQKQAKALMCEKDFGHITNQASKQHRAWINLCNSFATNITQNSEKLRLEFDLAGAHFPAQNIMTAIACLSQMAQCLHQRQALINHKFEALLITPKQMQNLINSVNMPGRMQIVHESPMIILDVAHNQAAAEYLLSRLQQIEHAACHIVVGMLKDKNIEATINTLSKLNARWYCASLAPEISAGRGEQALRLQKAVQANAQKAEAFDDVAAALQEAITQAQTNDMIVVLGSFIVASECMKLINSRVNI